MKRLNAFLILMLVILLCVVLLIAQNGVQVTIKFMFWNFSTTLGLFGTILFFSGLVIMWIITLFTHYRDVSKLKKQITEKEQKIQELEKASSEKEQKIQQLEEKIVEAQKSKNSSTEQTN
jgi:uncharacterized membrane protein YciS (DUF1049 family)